MPTDIKLPPLGENLDEGEVLEVKVAAGDEVSEGQTLLEIEAEKSTVEVPAPRTGRITEMLVKKGDVIAVGQVLGRLDDADGAAKPKAGAKQEESEEEDVEAEKEPAAKPEPRTEGDGRAKKETAEPPPERQRAEPTPQPDSAPVPAGPATRRLARELGVDLARVSGSARGGRVTQEDVKAFVRDLPHGTGGSPIERGAAPTLPDFSRWGPIERQPLGSIRRRTAEQMSLAWSLIPHVTQHDEADITDLDLLRREQSTEGVKLTVTAFALKASAVALKRFPQFNSSLDTGSGTLILKRYYHIGVAVDTEHGLLVPVVRDVDRKGVIELAGELAELAGRARARKLTADDMAGGTFTITNLGGIGGTAFTPIVNHPEVAILGLSRGRRQPVVRDVTVVPRLILPLSLSYDHRVIDGARAARFTRFFADLLENPVHMLL